MTKLTQYPCYRWDAEGNEYRCEGPQDVGAGWTDKHPKHFAEGVQPAPTSPAAAPAVLQVLTRDEIVAALNEGGVEFSKNAPTGALRNKLDAAVRAALTGAEIAFDPTADTRTLLGLLPQPE